MNNINQINPINKIMIYFLRYINEKLFQKLFSTKFIKQIIYYIVTKIKFFFCKKKKKKKKEKKKENITHDNIIYQNMDRLENE